MTSVQSSLDADADEVDLSGLVESIVDSDEEEDLAESMDVSLFEKNLSNQRNQIHAINSPKKFPDLVSIKFE